MFDTKSHAEYSVAHFFAPHLQNVRKHAPHAPQTLTNPIMHFAFCITPPTPPEMLMVVKKHSIYWEISVIFVYFAFYKAPTALQSDES